MKKKKVIDEKTVERVAELARIRLSGKEKRLYRDQLAAVLSYIEKLDKVDSSNIPPTSHPLGNLRNVFRKDEVRKSLTSKEALQNAPRKDRDFFSVPKII